MLVRVRFAPSPTGFVHIGGLRTALYNYLFARKNDGKYILRIEDTDRERYVEGAIEGMLKSMAWTGIEHDEGVVLDGERLSQKGDFGPYIQSQRLDIYQKHIKTLLESGDAYYCFCSKERLDKIREEQKAEGLTTGYDGHCRDISKEEVQKRLEAGEQYVIRLKFPKGKDIRFNDIIRGEVVMNTDDLDDQVLIKSDGFPTYHFAVVVDDHLMKITHIIRGEEWLSSTPKHVYLYKAFGWEIPQYVHLPNILNRDR
jgi:nondiscriminating glutamyl-tRNA synthetase